MPDLEVGSKGGEGGEDGGRAEGKKGKRKESRQVGWLILLLISSFHKLRACCADLRFDPSLHKEETASKNIISVEWPLIGSHVCSFGA